MNKLAAFWNLFRRGSQVADPALWKSRQINANMLASLLAAVIGLAKAFGYDVPLTDEQLMQIGGSVLAVFGLFNAGTTVVTSAKVGLPAKQLEFDPVDMPESNSVESHQIRAANSVEIDRIKTESNSPEFDGIKPDHFRDATEKIEQPTAHIWQLSPVRDNTKQPDVVQPVSAPPQSRYDSDDYRN